MITRSPGDEVAPRPARGRRPARRPRGVHRVRPATDGRHARPAAWEGLKILEFGSGAAGPIATRYFVEHGATVLRVESKTRPDFLRAYSMRPTTRTVSRARRCTTGSTSARSNVALNLKKPESVALVKRLVTEWCRRGRRELRAEGDEGLRPRLRHARRDQARPRDDQRVPQRPDRSAQGLPRASAARARRSAATTRSPAGPTASPSARTARSPTRSRRATSRPRSRPASCTGAARARACTSTSRRSSRRTGRCRRGCSTTRCDGVIRLRDGNRHTRTQRRTARSRAPTRATSATAGSRSRAGPTTQWPALAGLIGLGDRRRSDDARRAQGARRRDRGAALGVDRDADAGRGRRRAAGRSASRRCRSRTSATCTTTRSSRCRKHFEPHTHAFLGAGLYERNGFRLSDAPERVRPGRTDARPGHRLGAARPARLHRRRDRGAEGVGRGRRSGVSYRRRA